MKTINYLCYALLLAGLAACNPSPDFELKLNSDLKKTKSSRGEFVQLNQTAANDFYKQQKSDHLNRLNIQFDGGRYLENYLFPDKIFISYTGGCFTGCTATNLLETDGEYTYAIEDSLFKIYKDSSNSPEAVGELDIEEIGARPYGERFQPSILNVKNNNIIVAAKDFVQKENASILAYPVDGRDASTRLLKLDVTNKGAPVITNRGVFDKEMTTSKVIGDTLYYLFEHENITIKGVHSEIYQIVDQESNLQGIYANRLLRAVYVAMLESNFSQKIETLKSELNQQAASSYNVTYNYNGQKIKLDNTCHLNSNYTNDPNFHALTRYLVALNVDDLSLKHSMCYVEGSRDIFEQAHYAITDSSFYVLSNFLLNETERNTRVEYFSLGDSAIEHQGSEEVVGYVTGLTESNGELDLVAMTSRQNPVLPIIFIFNALNGIAGTGTEGTTENKYLHTLEISSNSIEVVEQLPDLARPLPID